MGIMYPSELFLRRHGAETRLARKQYGWLVHAHISWSWSSRRAETHDKMRLTPSACCMCAVTGFDFLCTLQWPQASREFFLYMALGWAASALRSVSRLVEPSLVGN